MQVIEKTIGLEFLHGKLGSRYPYEGNRKIQSNFQSANFMSSSCRMAK
jgi:hypothetical protein